VSVTGEVDGEKAPSFSESCLLESSSKTEFRAQLRAFSFDGGCGKLGETFEELTKLTKSPPKAGDFATAQEFADALVAHQKKLRGAAGSHFPETGFWDLDISFRVDDADDVRDDYDLQDDDDKVVVNLCHQTGKPKFNDEGVDERRECFRAEDGDLDVTAFEESTKIELTGKKIELVDDEDDGAGDIEITASARALPELQKSFDAFVKAQTKAAGGVEDAPGVTPGVSNPTRNTNPNGNNTPPVIAPTADCATACSFLTQCVPSDRFTTSCAADCFQAIDQDVYTCVTQQTTCDGVEQCTFGG
jgi:hypothetical protein